MVIGESRSDLLNWLNSTLDLDYKKVEQCGTGAAFCQLMDSVVGDVPMAKVKFNANTEYDYLHNFKILQASFNKHNIKKGIEVERLVKCRLQGNLELLQWFKRYWYDNKDLNVPYYPADRRPAVSGGNGSISSTIPKSRTSSGSSSNSRRSTLTNGRTLSNSRNSLPTSVPANKVSSLSRQLSDSRQDLAVLSEELQEYKILVESLETERNFYFNKLRDIEILTEKLKAVEEEELKKLSQQELIQKIQSILYSTEEGFHTNNEPADIDLESF